MYVKSLLIPYLRFLQIILISLNTLQSPLTDADSNLFDWDEELQGFILASFYVGYVITHVPGGVFASKYGGKYTLIVGMCVASVFTLLTPVCVEAGGAPALIALRIIIGLGEGVIFPSCAALISSWTPLADRGKIGTLTYSGAQIGSIFGSLMSGWLLDYYPGWGSVFYFFGVFGVVWSAFFVSQPCDCSHNANQHLTIAQLLVLPGVQHTRRPSVGVG